MYHHHLRRPANQNQLSSISETFAPIENGVESDNANNCELMLQAPMACLTYHYSVTRPGSLFATESPPDNQLPCRGIEENT